MFYNGYNNIYPQQTYYTHDKTSCFSISLPEILFLITDRLTRMKQNVYVHFVCLIYSFSHTEIEPRDLEMVNKCSITDPHPQILSCFQFSLQTVFYSVVQVSLQFSFVFPWWLKILNIFLLYSPPPSVLFSFRKKSRVPMYRIMESGSSAW